jgi:hypothetical protein
MVVRRVVRLRPALVLALFVASALSLPTGARGEPPAGPAAASGLLKTEKLAGEGVWIDPALTQALTPTNRVRATIWFEDQFLGDGKAYARRAKEFAGAKRRELRTAVMRTLRDASDRSWATARSALDALVESEGIRAIDRFWIVNGFSCGVTQKGLEGLKAVPGVRHVYRDTSWRGLPPAPPADVPAHPPTTRPSFDPKRYLHPWYIRYLLADKVWKRFGVTGKGTLNIIHDHNFLFSPNVTPGVYRNPLEKPGNGKDDDGNGLVDDYHGWNFNRNDGVLTTVQVPPGGGSGANLHGFMCGAIICGAGAKGHEYEFGIAPEGTWAGVISARRMEAAVQWAIEQGADTYSMSFSVPGKGEHRSHWRKLMEHGSFCGVCFVSGAGNFALQQKVPVQMRQPEDIPDAVFAAAGVHRDLTRTATSSQGPVEWNTAHYKDGTVQKPAVCAFNFGLPVLYRNGTVREGGLSGNSFAGPMFCGSIALMLSADPDLLPWDLREIITSTALDIADEGVDYQTGHGLINCYRAVKEVLRRKAAREGKPTKRYEGREPDDELDVASLEERVRVVAVVVGRLGPKGQAKALGVEIGDVIVEYGGEKILTRAGLREQIKAVRDSGVEEVPMVLRRGKQTITIKLKPGPIGIAGTERYNEPVFQKG